MAALTASPRSVSDSAELFGLCATSRFASAAAVRVVTEVAPALNDSSALGDGAPGTPWLNAASTTGSPGVTTAPTNAVTRGLKGDDGSA